VSELFHLHHVEVAPWLHLDDVLFEALHVFLDALYGVSHGLPMVQHAKEGLFRRTLFNLRLVIFVE
jgi:hypothetical protein